MDRTEADSLFFLSGDRVKLGGLELAVGDSTGYVVLRAIIGTDIPLAVFEHLEGGLAWMSEEGVEFNLEPFMEDAGAEGYTPAFFKALASAGGDPLAERVLEAGDASYDATATALPRVIDYALVGDARVDERVIVAADGSIEGLLGPLTDLGWDELAGRGRWGLLDSRLPLPVLRVLDDEGGFVEQTVVATVGSDGRLRPLVRRRTLVGDEENVEYLAPGSDTPTAPEEFYAAVLGAWMQVFAASMSMMSVVGGDELLGELAVSSLHLADMTMRGCHPRYGIGVYDAPKDHGFPPTVLHFVHCLLDWGHFERAEDILGNYLDAYVNLDGTFDYYGPALAEYGQMLALAARYVELTEDLRWWVRRQSVLRRIWDRLLDLRRAATVDQAAPPEAHGLVPGLPEADYHHTDSEWRQYYFSGDAWAVRGLREMAGLLRVTGQIGEASAIEAEVAGWADDLHDAVAAAKIPASCGIFVPPGPTQRVPYGSMTEDRHPSYVNYRYWAEMISAGVLDQETMRQVFDYRRVRGGELLGMTRFQDHLDDWPVLNYARALVELGQADRFILLMYAHLTQHQAAGWLTAYEQVTLLPDEHGLRRQHAGQVVPCQVTVPQMLRWALAYEMRDDDTLLIAPCVPWSWLAEGEPLQAVGVPTRWGIIDIETATCERRVYVDLFLPDDFDADLRVHVPAPRGARLSEITVNGEPYVGFDAQARIVNLSRVGGEIEIEATF